MKTIICDICKMPITDDGSFKLKRKFNLFNYEDFAEAGIVKNKVDICQKCYIGFIKIMTESITEKNNGT